MGTFNYKLRESRKGVVKIVMHYNYGRSKVFRISTGFQLKDKENWNDETQKVKTVIAEPKASIWNKSLRDLKNHFEDGYDELVANGEPVDKPVLKELFNDFSNSASVTLKKKSFKIVELMEQWIAYCENDKRTKKGKKLSKGTTKTYSNTKEVFVSFNKKHPVTSVKHLNKHTYNKLLSYLEQKGYTLNYIGKIIKNLKTFFSYLINESKIDLPNYTSTEWSVMKEDVNEIYLDNNELMKMFYIDLSHLKEAYSRARDLFLISAFTGLRISDNKLLEEEHIIEMEGYRFFQIHSQKTGEEVIIPISQIVEQIIERNSGLPRTMADQQINTLIKEVGEYVGIDESVRIKRTQGGESTERNLMKFELIKTHTARRSFCTNAYLGGMDTLEIMAVSGHKTEENFRTYIKVTKKQQALRTAKNEYFLSLNADKFTKDGLQKLLAV